MGLNEVRVLFVLFVLIPMLSRCQTSPDSFIENNSDLVQAFSHCYLKEIGITSSFCLLQIKRWVYFILCFTSIKLIFNVCLWLVMGFSLFIPTWQALSVTTFLSCHKSFLLPTRITGTLLWVCSWTNKMCSIYARVWMNLCVTFVSRFKCM